MTNRGVGANILSDAGSVTDLTVELVLVHTVGSGGFTDMAGAAGEHQLIGDAVFLGVEKVGTDIGISQRLFTEEGLGN